MDESLARRQSLRVATRQDRMVIPTGIIDLDDALGIGGIPYGRLAEIFGDESTGKSTITLHLAAQAQKLGHDVLWIDTLHTFDLDWAHKCGVDESGFFLSQPGTLEEAFEIAQAILDAGGVRLLVIDSLAGLSPRIEIEGEIGDSFLGVKERLLRGYLRKLLVLASRSKSIVVVTNVFHEEKALFGPDIEDTQYSIKYLASIRIWLARLGVLLDPFIVGEYIAAVIIKNRFEVPFRAGVFGILHSGQIIQGRELVRFNIGWFHRDCQHPVRIGSLLSIYESRAEVKDSSDLEWDSSIMDKRDNWEWDSWIMNYRNLEWISSELSEQMEHQPLDSNNETEFDLPLTDAALDLVPPEMNEELTQPDDEISAD